LNKVFVQESVYERVQQRLEERFGKLRTGNHLDKCNDYSVLINQNDLDSLKQGLQNQASQFGAQVNYK
jgi:acyl-CoA reductase-like NAD-dependent aldehyde dehydrogenase